jgi:subfamily B ATP-binding cassette protein HlyB/CyaB
VDVTSERHDVPPDSGLACLILLLGFHQVAADAGQLRHALGKSDAAQADDLVRLARGLGARSRLHRSTPAKLDTVPLPAIGSGRDGSFFILGGVRDGRVLLQPALGPPRSLTLEELSETWTGDLVLVTTRAEIGVAGAFDVTWFIPALIKYRGLLGEVLAASLVIQLFALATPLIFQMVIDKVLVHKVMSTLDVLAIGLVSVMVFDSVLSAMRAYVFAHTTNRVDVELGAKLYRHLVSLPLAYFETRRVGDSVARVRELDTIREFLTSSSITLLIDLLFTILFLVVMGFYSLKLLLIVLVAIALYAIVCVVITPPLRRRINERFLRGSETQAFIVESITGIQTLKAAAVEPQMQTRWERLLAAYVRSGFNAARLNIFGGQAIQLINKLTTAFILFFGAKLAIEGKMTVGELVAFNMLAGRVAEPVLRLATLWQQFQEARVGLDRLGDILNTPTETRFSPSRSALLTIAGAMPSTTSPSAIARAAVKPCGASPCESHRAKCSASSDPRAPANPP